jgi:hypothetical protein
MSLSKREHSPESKLR